MVRDQIFSRDHMRALNPVRVFLWANSGDGEFIKWLARDVALHPRHLLCSLDFLCLGLFDGTNHGEGALVKELTKEERDTALAWVHDHPKEALDLALSMQASSDFEIGVVGFAYALGRMHAMEEAGAVTARLWRAKSGHREGTWQENLKDGAEYNEAWVRKCAGEYYPGVLLEIQETRTSEWTAADPS